MRDYGDGIHTGRGYVCGDGVTTGAYGARSRWPVASAYSIAARDASVSVMTTPASAIPRRMVLCLMVCPQESVRTGRSVMDVRCETYSLPSGSGPLQTMVSSVTERLNQQVMRRADTVAGPTRAVIFVPEPGGILATIRCMEHCASREYDVVGIVRGDWAAVVDMVRGGVSDVVVVDRPDHIDPAWTPRIEVVADHPPVEPTTPAGRPARRRRPRRVT